MNEIEQNVWRSVRALTTLTVLVVLLLIAGSIANTFDLSLAAGWERGVATAPTLQEPTGPGIRVQSYAEIIPGVQNTAHAWALAPDEQGQMESMTVANQQKLQANAQSLWPAAPTPGAPLAMTGRSGLGNKETNAGVVTNLPTAPEGQPPRPVAVVMSPTISSGVPVLLVQQPLANLRGGPGTAYPILGMTHAGNRYPIVARSGEWWQITASGAPAWIHGALGVTEGNAGAVTVVDAPPLTERIDAAPAALSPIVTEAPTATPTRLPSYGYSVAMERHSEANTLVAYALIQDNQAIVGDLYLLVTHAGQQWRSGPSSYAVSGVTKPADPASPENKTYNAKIDFPRFLHPTLDLIGEWTITLVDGNNTPLSVTTVVQIAPNDPQREIYLHYRKVKL